MNFERNATDYVDWGWIDLENFMLTFYFCTSTFFTQIVILNMLIAIMSKTFDEHNMETR